MEYVIKNNRLKNYLYSLGFNYRKVPDKTNNQNFVFLFPNNEDIKTSIDFYTEMKNKQKQAINNDNNFR